jgi:hypothetical protein
VISQGVHEAIMTTNIEQVAAPVVTAQETGSSVWNLFSRATQSIHSAVCGLQGHDPLLQVEAGRMFLRCTTCGYETPGWTTESRGPRLRFAGDRERHRLS